jgi:hypothetical protein
MPGNYRWAAGVVLTGEECGLLTVEAIDCDTVLTTGDTEWGESIAFDPIVGFAARRCAVLSGRNDAELTAAAMMRLDEGLSYQIAHELYTGETSGNPAITVDPTVVTVSEALPICQAVAILIQEAGELIGNLEITLHVTAAALNVLASEGCVEAGPDGRFRTHAGHLVIGDAGYDGRAPEGEDPLGDGEEYVYATGPVAWDVGPEMDLGVEDAGTLGARTNRRRAQVQRPMLAVFDPTCLHLAVLAKLCRCC